MPSNLDGKYWDERYQNSQTGWDLGKVSPPLQGYFDQLTDKSLAILIPGCGNAYEAEYLLSKGFTNVTLVDISPVLCKQISHQLSKYFGRELTVICDDFFHVDKHFDLVIEQTFFCALEPLLREKYVWKMHEVLHPGGKLVGVMFDREFEGGPPFGGNVEEYRDLFQPLFEIRTMEPCYNSVGPRAGAEVFVQFIRR